MNEIERLGNRTMILPTQGVCTTGEENTEDPVRTFTTAARGVDRGVEQILSGLFISTTHETKQKENDKAKCARSFLFEGGKGIFKPPFFLQLRSVYPVSFAFLDGCGARKKEIFRTGKTGVGRNDWIWRDFLLTFGFSWKKFNYRKETRNQRMKAPTWHGCSRKIRITARFAMKKY